MCVFSVCVLCVFCRVDRGVHLLLQQFGGRHVSVALPPGAVEMRPGQDAVKGGRVLQSKFRLHEDLQIQNIDKQDTVKHKTTGDTA